MSRCVVKCDLCVIHYAMKSNHLQIDVIVICVGIERGCLSRVRTNSCQSDSSGFLEEPFVPAYPTPGPELMKVRLTNSNTFVPLFFFYKLMDVSVLYLNVCSIGAECDVRG